MIWRPLQTPKTDPSMVLGGPMVQPDPAAVFVPRFSVRQMAHHEGQVWRATDRSMSTYMYRPSRGEAMDWCLKRLKDYP